MAEDRLNMSLEEIISKQENKGGGKRSSGLKSRGNSSTNRSARTNNSSYSNNNRRGGPIKKHTNDDGELDIKFLSSNFLAGMLIGKAGEKIKSLSAETNAKITVSGQEDYYPGTNSRYITIKGSIDAVSQALSIIWELVALAASDDAEAKGSWVPSNEMTHNYDDVVVEGKMVVPAASVGKIIGKDMATIKSMVDSTGATVHFATRFEPSLPGESDRVVNISGEVIACAEVSSLILERVKLFLDHRNPSHQEGSGQQQHHEHGGRYTPADGKQSRNRTAQRKAKVGRGQARSIDTNDVVAEVLAANTTISLAVSNELIGNIIGLKGATLKQIQEQTKADVSISNR